MKKEKISLITPCYNEEEVLPIFYKELEHTLSKMKDVDFEIIFIDDGSKDKTLDIIKKLAKKDKRIKYLSFSRNFGKEAGMYAGLEISTGDYTAIMDVDLQDPPEFLIDMYEGIKEGYDSVCLYTNNYKKYPLVRRGLSKLWYKIISKISFVEQKNGARDFRLMNRKMVEAILDTKEYNRYSKGIFSFVGFKTKWLEYEIPERKIGESKFSLKKLLSYSLDGITSFSAKPLKAAAYTGLLFCIISFVAIIVIIIKTLVFGDPVQGWPSLACILIFVSGVQLLFLGIIGTYISKIYMEVKQRPLYIIRERNDK